MEIRDLETRGPWAVASLLRSDATKGPRVYVFCISGITYFHWTSRITSLDCAHDALDEPYNRFRPCPRRIGPVSCYEDSQMYWATCEFIAQKTKRVRANPYKMHVHCIILHVLCVYNAMGCSVQTLHQLTARAIIRDWTEGSLSSDKMEHEVGWGRRLRGREGATCVCMYMNIHVYMYMCSRSPQHS